MVSSTNGFGSSFKEASNRILAIEINNLFRIIIFRILEVVNLRLIDLIFRDNSIPEIEFRHSRSSHSANIHCQIFYFHEEFDVTQISHPFFAE